MAASGENGQNGMRAYGNQWKSPAGWPLVLMSLFFCAKPGVSLAANPSQAVPTRTPHIVYILADDFGYGDARCYHAESKIPTPHIDRLAREGIRFTDAHTPSAVCTPTRYGLLTGRYCWRTRLKYRVREGQPVQSNMLCFVCKGDRITISARAAGMAVKTSGIAQQDGVIGDTIRVENSNSRKTVVAEVASTQEVVVNL